MSNQKVQDTIFYKLNMYIISTVNINTLSYVINDLRSTITIMTMMKEISETEGRSLLRTITAREKSLS